VTRVRPTIRRALLGLVLVSVLLVEATAQGLPAPVGKVNDFAKVLKTPQRQALEAQLAELERATSAEVAVVTLRSLDGRSVEDYATELFNTWGIGKRGQDNGVLILVAVTDRAMRIEVGYGLEGVLPDGLAGEVIRETFLPRFRDNAYADGIMAGTARIVEIVRRNETLNAEQLAAIDAAAVRAGQSWVVAAFLSIFVGVGALVAGSGAGAQVAVQMLFGTFFMGMALFLATLGAPPEALALLVLFAVVVTVVSFRLGRRPDWRRSIRGAGTARGGWIAGGGGGGGSSGSGGSSSGGGFGGGSSGGGGASGRW
jgi:uncharacterized protein